MTMGHTTAEYQRNQHDMLILYQQLSWKDQVKLIGRLQVMVEKTRSESFCLPEHHLSHAGTVIQFPAL